MEHQFLDITKNLPWLRGDGRRAQWRGWAERLIGITKMRHMASLGAQQSPENPFRRVLELNGVHLNHANVTEQIPSKGGIMIIANHPLGVADAISLISLCSSVRPDLKTLANATLAKTPGMEGKLLPLLIFGEPDAVKQNLPTLRTTLKHLKEGGAIAVFPAGSVSHFQKDHGAVTDSTWSEHIAKIALKAGVPVLPIKYHEANPWWFQLPGALSKLVRTTLLLRCFLNRPNLTISCTGGALISTEELASQPDPTNFLRHSVYQIQSH